MPGMAQYHNIPLPKGWPRRVRSAVIQLISLAHYSLIVTRSWAADSWDSYPAGTTFAGAGLSPVGTTSLCTAHLVHYIDRRWPSHGGMDSVLRELASGPR